MSKFLTEEEDRKKKGQAAKYGRADLHNFEMEHTKGTQATLLMELFETAPSATSTVPAVRFTDAAASAHVLARKRVTLVGRIAWLFTCGYADYQLQVHNDGTMMEGIKVPRDLTDSIQAYMIIRSRVICCVVTLLSFV